MSENTRKQYHLPVDRGQSSSVKQDTGRKCHINRRRVHSAITFALTSRSKPLVVEDRSLATRENVIRESCCSFGQNTAQAGWICKYSDITISIC